jgi:FKBP-type peptidyl-prolyl cis-trans isomerase 2
MQVARQGDRVRIQYTCTVPCESGSLHMKPRRVLELTVGKNGTIPGLSRNLAGMHQGERKCVSLSPEEAFGLVKPGLVREIPRSQLRKQVDLRVGMTLAGRNKNTGRMHRVRVVEINPNTILVDGNHRLAGKTVRFDIYLVSIDSSSETNPRRQQYDTGGEG